RCIGFRCSFHSDTRYSIELHDFLAMTTSPPVMRALRATILPVIFIAGCKENIPPSLYDPNAIGGAAPTITNVSPPDSALAGVTAVTITGANFSSVKENNSVFFNDLRATVLVATPTQLRVTAPILVKDTVFIKIAVVGSDLF